MKVRRQLVGEVSFFPCCLTVLSVSIGGMAYAQQTPPLTTDPLAQGQNGLMGLQAGQPRGSTQDSTDPAQRAATQSQPIFVTSIRLTETLTDNVGLVKSSDARSDLITLINPSVLANSRTGRVQGSLQAAYNGSFYSEDQNRNQGYFTLRGNGRVEAWEQRGFIDLNTSITRQTLSAFSAQPGDSVTGTNNLSEVRNLIVSPFWTEKFGENGKAELRYTFSETDSSSNAFKQTQRNMASLNAGDTRAFGDMGWSVALSDSVMSTTGRRDLKQQSARLTGLWQLTPQVLLRVIGGTEANNIQSIDTRRSTIYGTGADWSPNPTTKVSALWEDRFFGPGYQMSAEHRGPVFVLNARYSKDVNSTSQSLAAVTEVNTYDLLMSMSQSQYPDEAERDAYVRQYIADRGLPDNVGVSQAVLSNGVYLDRRLRLGMSIVGARNTLVFSGFHSDRSTITDQSFSIVGGDFQTASRIKEISGSVVLSHLFTPLTSGNLGWTVSNSHRETTNSTLDQSNRTRRFTMGLVTKFTQKASGMLTLRNARAEGASSYTENAAVASVAIKF